MTDTSARVARRVREHAFDRERRRVREQLGRRPRTAGATASGDRQGRGRQAAVGHELLGRRDEQVAAGRDVDHAVVVEEDAGIG